MVVDPRRDHSLRILRPDRSLALSTPNACNVCHLDRSAQWAAEAIASWYPQRKPGFQGFAEAFAAAERNRPTSGAALATLATDGDQPAIVRASALRRLAPFLSPDVLPAVTRALADPDPLVRSTAAELIGEADAATRAERLTPLLRDPVRLVRMAAARALAGEPEARLLTDERAAFTAALDEWVAAQRFNADRPEAQANLGTLHAARGAMEDAVAAYQRALTLDRTFVQAAVNLADVYRTRNDEVSAERVLRATLADNRDSAAAYHALGLSLVRSGRTDDAMPALRKAASLDQDVPRYAYVYAVALHDTGDVAGSIRVLSTALARHPYDEGLRSALSAYQNE
jgi:tetratricopeptide (TPR) repeat protein